ncbi:hypothetical protein D0962_37810 [Leptolyngbyaceae cyanobacterium CCMR0082]|uniref:Uncharacterized protein n=1 Tax=Adonisia turfae CCMR0082 TaxID=2304604 RepID=A0A6M0SIJ4_9CYAN|nr:hypothetical protein [Adonisia turfae]NEZ68410.1 hypothetical protein [Adonisia turfae CCMR0082]
MQLDRVNQHRVVGGSTALSGVLSLALLANPITDVLGVILLCSGLGYSMATQLLAAWTRDEEKRLNHKATAQEMRFESDRQKLKAELKAVKDERVAIAEQIKQVEQRRDSYQAKLKAAFDNEVAQATQFLGDEAKARIAQLETEYAQKAEDADRRALVRIKKHKSQHREYERQLHTRIADLEKTCVQHDEYLRAEFDRALAGTDSILEEEIIGIQSAKKQALAEIHERDLIIERLKGMVEANSAPKKFRGSSADDQIANQVIDILLGAGIKVHGDNWDRKYHQLILWVESESAVTLEIESQLERIEIDLGLYKRPSVAIDRGLYKFVLDTDQKVVNKEVPTTPLTRVEATVDNANHLRIVGPSGSGKSTWLDNVIWLGKLLWPTANSRILDPKYPFTEWSNLTPDFKNDECIEAITTIGDEMRERFKSANGVADKYSNDSPEFRCYIEQLSYELFVIDEAQDLHRRSKACDRKLGNRKNELANGVRDSLLECLGVGRALKVKGYFITQSAKCSKINLNEDDFDNCVSIFLGASINYALNKELKDSYSSQKLAKVESEYRKRKEAGQQYLGLISDLEGDDLYLFKLPQPGHYHNRVMRSQTGVATLPTVATVNAETLTEESTQLAQETRATAALPEIAHNLPTVSPDLASLLKQGTHCPDCGTHSTSYKSKKPTKAGEVRLRCKNPDCQNEYFKWKVIN